MRVIARFAQLGALLISTSVANAQSEGPTRDPLLDRVHTGIYDTVWRSAMHIDYLFGGEFGEQVYQRGVSGSIAPILLWDEFNRFTPRLRFNVGLPLPRLDERFHAFIGRLSRDELVTERGERSSAFRRQFGPARDEQTIFGIAYGAPIKQGWSFDAGTGVRLQFPLDPYAKSSFVYEHGAVEDGSFSFRQTGFWQESEQFGTTSRVDLRRLFADPWLVCWTASGTISQKSSGVRGYSSLTGLRGFPGRRAFAMAVGFNGESEAAVPMQDYGVKFAWRQGVARDWLVLELRTSLDWPKEQPDQPRRPSWGMGIGFEMFFGTNEFFARPITF